MGVELGSVDQDERIAEIVGREAARLRRFIRRRVSDRRDAEDVLQDVFEALVEANRLLMPIEYVAAWLYRVARNRITDLFRRTRLRSLHDAIDANGEPVSWEDVLPSPAAGPDAAYTRGLLVEALARAVAELPEDQRDVFVAHEIEGRSFKEIAAETGVGINTLLSRKHYAVRRLRARLQAVHDEFDAS